MTNDRTARLAAIRERLAHQDYDEVAAAEDLTFLLTEIAEAESRGAERERARVVEWLRNPPPPPPFKPGGRVINMGVSFGAGAALERESIANAVESGEHEQGGGDG